MLWRSTIGYIYLITRRTWPLTNDDVTMDNNAKALMTIRWIMVGMYLFYSLFFVFFVLVCDLTVCRLENLLDCEPKDRVHQNFNFNVLFWYATEDIYQYIVLQKTNLWTVRCAITLWQYTNILEYILEYIILEHVCRVCDSWIKGRYFGHVCTRVLFYTL